MTFVTRVSTALMLTTTLFAFASTAEARSHHHSHHIATAHPAACQGFFCPSAPTPQSRAELHQQQLQARLAARQQQVGAVTHQTAATGRGSVQIIGGRPQGCPPTKFCACALAVKIFGHQVPGLNLAIEWVRRFPHVQAAPDMVAARGGHAFQLLAHVEGLTWTVYDANSGGHLTRIHNRSIAGFTIVNPNGARYAMN